MEMVQSDPFVEKLTRKVTLNYIVKCVVQQYSIFKDRRRERKAKKMKHTQRAPIVNECHNELLSVHFKPHSCSVRLQRRRETRRTPEECCSGKRVVAFCGGGATGR